MNSAILPSASTVHSAPPPPPSHHPQLSSYRVRIVQLVERRAEMAGTIHGHGFDSPVWHFLFCFVFCFEHVQRQTVRVLITLFLTACTTVRVLPCFSQTASVSVSYLVSHSLHHCPCLTLSLTACTAVRALPCLSQPAPLSVSYLVFQSLHYCPCLTVSLTACTTVRVLPCLSEPAPLFRFPRPWPPSCHSRFCVLC